MLTAKRSRIALTAVAGLAFVAFMPDTSVAVSTEPAAPSAPPKQQKKKPKKKKTKQSQIINNDAAIYSAGYWAAKRGEYALALATLRTAHNQSDTSVQTMIGFSLRSLGHVDEAMGYYAAALAQNPDLTTTRQYLGEAYLQKGDKAAALEQLEEIAKRCGTTCNDYRLLASAIDRS